MKRLRLPVWFSLLVVMMTAAPTRGLAALPGEYEGYCKDGVPVVISWPEKYKEFVPWCDGDRLSARWNPKEINGEQAVVLERPDDFGRWAYIYLNGKNMANPYRDAFPYVVKSTGRTLIPIRMVTEAMGGTADWNAESRKVTIRLGVKQMEMIIGDSSAVANGQSILLDQPPLIWKDRTLVPLRVIVEAFGASVAWTDQWDRVDITMPGVTCNPKFCPF